MFTTRDNVNTESTQLTISSTPIPGLVHLRDFKVKKWSLVLMELIFQKEDKT